MSTNDPAPMSADEIAAVREEANKVCSLCLGKRFADREREIPCSLCDGFGKNNNDPTIPRLLATLDARDEQLREANKRADDAISLINDVQNTLRCQTSDFLGAKEPIHD